MAGKYTIRSKEEKLAIVKRNLAGETSRSLAVTTVHRTFALYRSPFKSILYKKISPNR